MVQSSNELCAPKGRPPQSRTTTTRKNSNRMMNSIAPTIICSVWKPGAKITSSYLIPTSTAKSPKANETRTRRLRRVLLYAERESANRTSANITIAKSRRPEGYVRLLPEREELRVLPLCLSCASPRQYAFGSLPRNREGTSRPTGARPCAPVSMGYSQSLLWERCFRSRPLSKRLRAGGRPPVRG